MRSKSHHNVLSILVRIQEEYCTKFSWRICQKIIYICSWQYSRYGCLSFYPWRFMLNLQCHKIHTNFGLQFHSLRAWTHSSLVCRQKSKEKFLVITNAEDVTFDRDCGSSLELVLMILISSENETWKTYFFYTHI